jgi:hypothetical protein
MTCTGCWSKCGQQHGPAIRPVLIGSERSAEQPKLAKTHTFGVLTLAWLRSARRCITSKRRSKIPKPFRSRGQPAASATACLGDAFSSLASMVTSFTSSVHRLLPDVAQFINALLPRQALVVPAPQRMPDDFAAGRVLAEDAHQSERVGGNPWCRCCTASLPAGAIPGQR